MSGSHHTPRQEVQILQGGRERNVLSVWHPRSCLGWMIVMFFIGMQGSACFAQDSPLNPNYCAIQPFGTMEGWILKGGNQVYGQFINPVGDVNGDGLADWIIVHNRVDTSFESETARELLLYHGIPGGLPSPQSGQRIGPEEIGSASKFLCAGYFDSDPYIDLVVAEEVFGDTTDGVNTDDFSSQRVVVYWGRQGGGYSNADTSHLLNPGRVWLGFRESVEAIDRRQQSMNDLLVVRGEATFENGILKATALLHLYELSESERWGRNGQSRQAQWQLWNVPRADRVSVMDHDGDGRQDLVFINDDVLADSVQVSVLYGSSVGYFDTTSIERISLQRANGRAAEMLDITGDSIPDLVVNAGSQERIKIFIGRRGHRLKEQYGTGIDPPDVAGGRPFARPWAQILLPHSVDTTWRRMGFERLWDFGDVGNDGIADAVVSAILEDLYVYSTGEYSDSYLDAVLVTSRSVQPYAARLGDIDGSGRDAIAVRYSTRPGGIAFYHTSGCVEDAGGNLIPLPPGTGRPTTSVEDRGARAVTGAGTDLYLAITPNPSVSTVALRWSMRGAARVCVYDVLGNECGLWMTSGNQIELDLSEWSRGEYLITVQTPGGVASEHLVLR